MDMNYEKLLEQVTQHLRTMAQTETVIGKEFQLGEFTVVPVIKMGMGFGSGGGGGNNPKTGQGSGGGAGAGVGIQPVAFLVSRGDQISLLNIGKPSPITAIFDKVPDLMDKIIEMRNKTNDETVVEE